MTRTAFPGTYLWPCLLCCAGSRTPTTDWLGGIAVGPAKAFERMNDFLNQHKIKPVIDTVYGFDQAREAYEHLGRGAFGKLVIKVA